MKGEGTFHMQKRSTELHCTALTHHLGYAWMSTAQSLYMMDEGNLLATCVQFCIAIRGDDGWWGFLFSLLCHAAACLILPFFPAFKPFTPYTLTTTITTGHNTEQRPGWYIPLNHHWCCFCLRPPPRYKNDNIKWPEIYRDMQCYLLNVRTICVAYLATALHIYCNNV